MDAAPLPIRPLKLRLAVEMTLTPSPGMAPQEPQQEPQPGVTDHRAHRDEIRQRAIARQSFEHRARSRRDHQLDAARHPAAGASECRAPGENRATRPPVQVPR